MIKDGPDCGKQGVVVEATKKGQLIVLADNGHEWTVDPFDIESLEFLATQGIIL